MGPPDASSLGILLVHHPQIDEPQEHLRLEEHRLCTHAILEDLVVWEKVQGYPGQFLGSSPERRTVEELESQKEGLSILWMHSGIRLQPGEVLGMSAFNEKATDSKLWDHL